MNVKKINQSELYELFGDEIPIEAVNLFFNSPGDLTLGELREQLRDIAKKYKIKPCPFCGPRLVEPDVYQPDLDALGEDKSRWAVACGGCGTHSGYCKTKEDALALWNSRPLEI